MSLLDVEPIFHSRVVLDHAHTVRGRRFRFHCHLRRQVEQRRRRTRPASGWPGRGDGFNDLRGSIVRLLFGTGDVLNTLRTR